MAQGVSRQHLNAEALVKFEDIPSRIFEGKMWRCNSFCLSTSVLPCQYYSVHSLYSSSSNVAHSRRTKLVILSSQAPFYFISFFDTNYFNNLTP